MTITNTQSTELSLDQLDDISAGFIGAALRGAKAAVKTVGAMGRHGAKAGLRSCLNPRDVYSAFKSFQRWGGPVSEVAGRAATSRQCIVFGAKIGGIGAAVAGSAVGITRLFK